MENEDNSLIMVCHLRSANCWHTLRVFNNDTFDLLYTCSQPEQDDEVPRVRFNFSDVESMVLVGEIRDWVKGIIRPI